MNGDTNKDSEHGIVPRSVDLIFDTLQKYQDDGILTNESKVMISCIEIYRDVVQDLFDPSNRTM